MTHVCTQIREAAKSMLSNIEGIEDHITFDEPRIAEDDESPWVWIYTGDEIINTLDLGDMGVDGQLLQRDSDLIIEITVRGKAIDLADTLLARIERAIALNRKFQNTAKNSVLRDIQRARTSDVPSVSIRARYTVTYITTNIDPETPV